MRRVAPLWLVLWMVATACSSETVATTTTIPEVPPSSAVEEPLLSTTTTSVVKSTTTTVEPPDRWEVGDCLRFQNSGDLPYEPYGSGFQAACADGYTHEVYYSDTFPGGPDAGYPEETINPEIRDICIGEFVDYFGVLPVEVALDFIMYLPDADEWANGLRYQTCVVYRPAGADSFGQLTGSIAGLGSEYRLEVSAGSCFAIPYVKVPQVECEQSHLAETIGTVTHPGELDAEFPGDGQLETFAISECNLLVADYVVESTATNPVIAFARGFSEQAWETGWRELRCMAMAVDRNGRPVQVRGSFAEDGWTVPEVNQSI